jgi:uncharacterized protein YndB with AHSA1/START domain
MSEYGIVTEAGAVRFERLLPGPIEHVWAYLTQSDKRGTWLAAGPMDARVGGRVDLHSVTPSCRPKRRRPNVTRSSRTAT